MSRPDPRRVESSLARLDRSRCVSFVEALWTARGFETRRDGRVVVATRGAESSVIYPVCPVRFGSPSAPKRPVDVVVAPRGGRAASAIADRYDARLLDAVDLSEMLTYAVDPTDAEALRERCLNGGQWWHRFPTRSPFGPSRASGESSGRSPAFAPAMLVFVAVVALAGAVVVGAPGMTLGDERPGASSDPPTQAALSSTPTATPTPQDTALVPGVTEKGITNLSALDDAHERALENRSYTVRINRYVPRYRTNDGPRIQRAVDVAVEGNRYVMTTTRVDRDTETLEQSAYYDGSDWFIADTRAGSTSYRRIPGSGGAPGFEFSPSRLRYTLVPQYLSTPETAVTGRVEWRGAQVYRVVGRGWPVGLAGEAGDNYTSVALVSGDGFVHDLTVEYTRATEGGGGTVTIEVTYGNLDETVVEEPWWYERRFGG